MDRRSRARELAMQGLYQLDVQGGEALEMLGEFLADSDADEPIRKMAAQWTRQVWENLPRCDELIKGTTIRWQFGRLSPVDRSILRLAVFQLVFCEDIPPKVAINEAIELAKKFSTEKSPGFVNGVLDAIHRKLSTVQQGGS